MDARRPLLILSLGLISAGLACAPQGVEVTFAVPRGGFPDFLETPWPSDLLVEDGRLDLGAFPNPGQSATLEEYLTLFARAPGYSAAAAFYFHVPGGVDEDSLPADPRASLSPDASMFLRTLADPSRRIPVEWKSFAAGTSFLPAGTVVVRPMLGATFHEPVVLVVTDRARASTGEPLVASPDLKALLTCAPLDVEVECAPYQSVGSSTVGHVALAQIVTPRDATFELAEAAALVREQAAPRIRDLQLVEQNDFYDEYRGTVELSQLLAGEPPYTRFDRVTGGFTRGEDGKLEVHGVELVDVVLTLPRAAPPERGYPVALYGHGTGGDLESPLGRFTGNPARSLAQAGWAMVATSEPLHLGRAGYRAGQEQLLTFNFLNPLAGRDIWRQSVIEKVQLISALETLELPGITVPGSGRQVEVDPSRIGFMGHSQGGIIGALLIAVEERAETVFLSGAGAGISVSLVEKTEPYKMDEILQTLLALDVDEPIDRFHPIPNLVQLWIDEADPIAYGERFRGRGGPPTHVVATAGLLDPYTPKGTQVGLVGAYRLPLVEPIAERFEVVDLLGIGSVRAGSSLNATNAAGRRMTRGLLQYPNDGHFPVFYNDDAIAAVQTFFATAKSGAPIAKVR